MTEVPATVRTGRPDLHRYEMWIRTVVSPALVASFPVRAERTSVPRRTIRVLRTRGACDISSLVRRLAESGVEVLELRVVDRAA